MELHERAAGLVVIVDVDGPLERDDAGYTILLARLRGILDRGARNIVLNVAKVGHIDSLLLGVIVEAYVSAVRKGGGLKLVRVGERFRHLLSVTKLDRILESFDTEDGALASFPFAEPDRASPPPGA